MTLVEAPFRQQSFDSLYIHRNRFIKGKPSKSFYDACVEFDARLSKLKPREFYEARAKSIIKELRESRGVSYKELARRLEPLGGTADDRVLINRINRGGFSFAFALQVLAALDATSVEVPKPPVAKSHPKTPAKPRG